MCVREAYLHDGARDFGNGVIGPTPDDIEWANKLSPERNPAPDSINSLDKFLIIDRVPRSFLKKLPFVAGPLVAGGLVYGAVCNGDGEDSKPNPGNVEPQRYSRAMPFAAGETWYYTGGPHFDGLSDGVKYAFDVAPSPKPIACVGGVNKVYREKYVRAVADGEVINVGAENDPDDKYHSIVEVEMSDGVVFGSMHLSEIVVEEGQKVKQGDPLGFASCAVPPGGSTGGIHNHEYIKEDGEPLAADGQVLSGWKIQDLDGNYQGVLTSGDQTRVADTRRCGPDEKSIVNCGGIRNDITWYELGVVPPIPTKPIPTKTPIPKTKTPMPTKTSEPKPSVEPEPSGVLTLDGKGDGVQIANSESLNFSGDMTIEARIRIPEGSLDGYDTIIAKGTRTEPFALWASFWKCKSPRNAVAVLLKDVGLFCSDAVIPEGEWVDVSMARIGDSLKISIGDEMVFDGEAKGLIGVNKEPMFIGMSPVPVDEDFKGEIDYVRLKGVNDELLGYWDFDGNLDDSSGNSNNGIFVGDAYIR